MTHVDALCYVGCRDKAYNGLSFEKIASVGNGCYKLGIVNLSGVLVTRGILIDMPDKALRRQDVEAWEAKTGTTISSGDALFLRTGCDVGQTGGYHPSLLPFFKAHATALLGADVPQEGGQIEGVAVPVHFFTLVASGVHLFDNLALEELARTARELNTWQFMVTAALHVGPNGAGSTVNPLAIVWPVPEAHVDRNRFAWYADVRILASQHQTGH